MNHREELPKYKALTPQLLGELEERLKRMWYAPNIDMGKLESDDLLVRIRQIEAERYIVPAKYGMLVFHYKDWLNDYIMAMQDG